MENRIDFTANEQNALALLCEMMSKAAHEADTEETVDEGDVVDSVCDIAEKFPNGNWGHLYDKFHRQGVNG